MAVVANSYVDLLHSEPAASGPRLRPCPAAALLIVDHGAGAPRVLMGRRNPALAFMPGKYVFPGGRLERADRAMHAASELGEQALACLTANGRRSAGAARALALAAVRETFEETGILVGERSRSERAHAPSPAWERFAQAEVLPKLDCMHVVARAVTPPGRPRRFDTVFFSVDARWVVKNGEFSCGLDDELTELVWAPVADPARYDMASITRVVLHELADALRTGFERRGPVPFYRMARGRWRRDEI